MMVCKQEGVNELCSMQGGIIDTLTLNEIVLSSFGCK